MRTIRSIFVSGDSVLDEIVKKTTDARFSHVGVGIDLGEGDVIVEALIPSGVGKSPIDKYNQYPVFEMLETPVDDDQYLAAVATAKILLGKAYGYDDCLIGGITDTLGQKIGEKVAEALDWDGTMDCSAVHTTIFRAVFPDYLEGRDESTITPIVAYHGVLDLNHKLSTGMAYGYKSEENSSVRK
jgi:hypothetical protein